MKKIRTLPTATRFLRALACAAFLATLPAYAATDDDCIETGGKTICVQPIFKIDPALNQDSEKFSYSYCEDTQSYIAYGYRLCIINGGAWSGSNETGTCSGTTPTTVGNYESRMENFIGEFVASDLCGYNLIGQSGWGVTLPVGDQCAPGSDVVQNGKVLQTRMYKDFGGYYPGPSGCGPDGWQRRMVATKNRQLVCPPGYAQRYQTNGDMQCAPLPPCERCAGNPINIGNGAKIQREVDYTSPAPGGHTFTRYYNSYGASHIDPSDAKPSDVWRHTYSRVVRKVKDPTNPTLPSPYVKGKAIRPDGSHIYFDLQGKELHNLWGGGHKIEEGPLQGSGATGWILTTPEGDREEYAVPPDLGESPVISVTTRQGFRTTLERGQTTQGPRLTVTDHFGREILIQENDRKQVLSFTDPAGRVTNYLYDGDKLAKVVYPNGKTREYAYDSRFPQALISITDERGLLYVKWTYDELGRAQTSEHGDGIDKVTLAYTTAGANVNHTVTDAFGTMHQYNFNRVGGVYKAATVTHTNPTTGSVIERAAFDAQGNPTYQADNNNVRTNFIFDSQRNLETSRTEGLTLAGGTTPATRSTTTTWHANYRLPTQISGPGGNGGTLTTTFGYDPNGNLTQLTETSSSTARVTDLIVNALGQPTSINGPRLDAPDTTTITYFPTTDACKGCRGQVKTVTSPAGHLTSFVGYDDDGRLLQFTDPNGVSTSLTYHVRGWLASQTTTGLTTVYDYDDTGNLTKVTLPGGDWMMFTYDIGSRLVGLDDSDGNAIDYQLDAKGNRVETQAFNATDGLTLKHQQVVDGLNRIAKTLGANNQVTLYTTNGEGQVTQVTDAEARTTGYQYDEINRLSKITLAGGTGQINFTYTAGDLIASIKDPRNLTTTYGYNGFGDLMTLASPETGTTTFTVDEAGNTKTKTDARNVTTTYSYDAENRLLAATVADGTVSFTYDDNTVTPYAQGKLTQITDPSGNTKFVYDAQGQVTSTIQVTAGTTLTTGYTYVNGKPTGITLPSGNALTYTYGGKSRIQGISLNGNAILGGATYLPFSSTIKQFTFANSEPYVRTYDQDGVIKTITLGPQAGTYEDFGQTFGYDGIDRLISATVTGAPSQTRKYVYDGVNRTSSELGTSVTTYNYQANTNKLTSLTGATARSYGYDAAGNMTSLGGTTLVYDGRGRLKQAGSSTYLVNGFGQRVAKTVGGATRLFVYDLKGHLIGEYDQNGTVIQETVWLYDTPVAVIKPKAGGGYDVFNVFADYLNTPRIIANQQNQMVWRWDNVDPFGYTQPNQNPSNLGIWEFNGRFPGQYFDAELGTYYNYFRDCYVPEIGRYCQSDPIGLAGGISTYGYVAGNPIKNTDPEGLRVDSITAACANPINAAICAELGFFGINAAVSGALNIGAQLYKNNGDLSCINWGEAGQSAVIGGVFGFAFGGVTKAWQLAKAANTSKNVAVLGHFPQYKQLAARLGAETFDVGAKWATMNTAQRWAMNKAFLDAGIARGTAFILANDVRAGMSYFRAEIQYLLKNGYEYGMANGMKALVRIP